MSSFNNLREPLLQEQNDHDNWDKYGRLCYLLQDEAPCRLRQYLLGHLPDGKSLDVVLAENRNVFNKQRKLGRINQQSYELLYPALPGYTTNVNSYDMTLLVCVIRNVTANARVVNWDRAPGVNDKLPQHDIIRLKLARNDMSHVSLSDFDRAEFQKLWRDVTDALARLGTPREVLRDYETRDLDSDATNKCMLKLKQQALDDMITLNKEEAKSRRWNKITVFGFVFVVLALLISLVSLVVHLTTDQPPCRNNIHVIDLENGVLQVIDRSAWGANAPKKKLTASKLPFENVIVSHSAFMGGCRGTDDCCEMVKKTQEYNQNDKQRAPMDDIAYNYMVGGDNVIYEGRGSDYQGAFAKGWNNISLGFSFIGEFSYSAPADDVVNVAEMYLEYLASQGVLTKNYTVYGHCQLSKKYPLSPGWALYQRVQRFRHWVRKLSYLRSKKFLRFWCLNDL